MSMPELQSHMSQLRHLTFKRLTEQTPSSRKSGPGGGSTGGAGGSAAAAAGSGVGAGSTGAASFGAAGGAVELGRVRGASPQQLDNPFKDQSHANFSTLPL
jgi:hypothetical protein